MSNYLTLIVALGCGLFSQAGWSREVIPDKLQMTFACFEQCQRNSIAKVDGQWKSLMVPVNTFTISLVKENDRFEMSASGGTETKITMHTTIGNIPTAMSITKIYQYKTNSDGDLIETYYVPPSSVGSFHENGELEINELNGCSFKRLPARGEYVFLAQCKEDFFGIVELTRVKKSPHI